MYSIHDAFQRIAEDLTRATDSTGFSPIERSGGEHHGSWVWSCAREDATEGIVRYAALAITEWGDRNFTHLVEGLAAADDKMHYHKILVRSFGINPWGLSDEGIRPWIVQLFKSSLERANVLSRSDLTLLYAHPVRTK
jgi:hypothetical protein